MPKRPTYYEDLSRTTKWRCGKNRNNESSSSDDEVDGEQNFMDPSKENPVECGDNQNNEEIPPDVSELQHGGPDHKNIAVDCDAEQGSEGDVQPAVEDNLGNEGQLVDDLHALSEGDDDNLHASSEDDDDHGANLRQSDEDPLESSSESEVEEEGANEEERLYNNSQLSLQEAMLLILLFVSRHKLSGVCFSDLLRLLKLLLPTPNTLKGTLYTFKKYFQHLQGPIVLHYFCENCQTKLDGPDSLCTICESSSSCQYFIEIPIADQLKRLLLRKDFVGSVQYPSERQKQDVNNIEDLYDGRVYKEYVAGLGSTADTYRTLSFMWNTDGVSVFKSSTFSIWPFFLAVNELPPQKRFLKENMILAGLWFGYSKPIANLFLNGLLPAVEQLRAGINCQIYNRDRPELVKGFVICGTCDTPAKSLMFNQIGHNGYYGCPLCKQKGEKSARTNNVFVYPIEQARPLRNADESWEHAGQAHETGQPTFGFKGPALIFCFALMAIRTTAVDAMHAVYSGVVRKLMKLWIAPEFSRSPYSIRNVAHLIDKRVLEIKCPHFVDRLPSSILESLTYWKASEFRSWLLYYAVPVLYGIIDQVYFNHFMLLVHAIYILNSRSVSEDDLTLASSLLLKFVTDMEELYELRFMTINFHLLLHIPDMVRDLGPLWVTSCFGFENLNGELNKLVHGTRHVAMQICSSMSIITCVPHLVRSVTPGPVLSFAKRLSSKRKNDVRLNETISDGTISVGKYTRLRRLPPYILQALNKSNLAGRNVSVFYRLLKRPFLYVSSSYKRGGKMCSSTVAYLCENETLKGIVKCFLRLTECDCPGVCDCPATFHCVLQTVTLNMPFQTYYPNSRLDFICQSSPCDDYVLVDVKDMVCVCWAVNVEEKMFIIAPSNMIELE